MSHKIGDACKFGTIPYDGNSKKFVFRIESGTIDIWKTILWVKIDRFHATSVCQGMIKKAALNGKIEDDMEKFLTSKDIFLEHTAIVEIVAEFEKKELVEQKKHERHLTLVRPNRPREEKIMQEKNTNDINISDIIKRSNVPIGYAFCRSGSGTKRESGPWFVQIDDGLYAKFLFPDEREALRKNTATNKMLRSIVYDGRVNHLIQADDDVEIVGIFPEK